MTKNYSNKNLQKTSFKNEDLSYASFTNSDLRGVDFSGANLIGANLTHVKTGLTTSNSILIFFVALVVSLLSGYIAMLAGHTIQGLLASKEPYYRPVGIVSIAVIVLFILFSWWKGVGNAIIKLIIPAALIALLTGLVSYLTGLGTGMGMVYLSLAYFFVAVMFIVGTVARAAAGTLSSTILFLLVALGGGMFGKGVGGGIGTVIMAISCALISKRALSGAKGFDVLRKIAFYITRRFGTSFRNTKLSKADFSRSKIQNADFTNADISFVNWGDSKKTNCIANGNVMTVIKNEKHG